MKPKKTILLVSLFLIIALWIYLYLKLDSSNLPVTAKKNDSASITDSAKSKNPLIESHIDSTEFARLYADYQASKVKPENLNDSGNYGVHIRNIEEVLIKKFPMNINRKGPRLVLKIGDFDSLVFKDVRDTIHTDNIKVYSVADFNSKAGYYVLSEGWLCGGTAWLINQKTGKMTKSDDEVVFSPDGNFILTFEDGRGMPMTDNSLKLFRTGKQELIELVNTDPPFCPAAAVWLDNQSFALETAGKDDFKKGYIKYSVKLAK